MKNTFSLFTNKNFTPKGVHRPPRVYRITGPSADVDTFAWHVNNSQSHCCNLDNSEDRGKWREKNTKTYRKRMHVSNIQFFPFAAVLFPVKNFLISFSFSLYFSPKFSFSFFLGGSFPYRHLALVHPANSVVIRSTFGPFFARHAIDPFETEFSARNSNSSTTSSASSFGSSSKDGAPRKAHKVSVAPNKQISAYLVTRQVRRSQPVLRVLFYVSHLAEYESRLGQFDSGENNLCAAVIGK